MGQHLHCHHPIPAELLTDDGRDAAGVAGGFIARDDRPTDSNGNLVDAHLHPRRTSFRLWSLLFISVYRLPGGVAATVGAVQPLMVVFISPLWLGSPMTIDGGPGAICGTVGVALVLTPNAALDPVGVATGGGGFRVRNRAGPASGNLLCLCHLTAWATGGRRTSARSSSFSV
uniref:Uncharacterized protein n=1 Tax=Escherichia coli TaxID=562 RepID=A0A8F1IFN8_ECOLX|nr:hypothetical protein IHCLGBEB_00176 [Escherichia coli]